MKNIITILTVTAALTLSANAQVVGHWRFENSIGNLQDSGPNNLDLTDPTGDVGFGSNATLAPGFSNPVPQTGAANSEHAFLLGGSVTTGVQQLELADNAFMPTGDFTIEGYVRWGAEVINNPVVGDIASQWAAGQQAFRFGIGATNLLQIGIANVGATPFFTTSGSFTFVANTDYYVAAAVDLEAANATSVTFYVQDLTNAGSLQTISGVTAASTLPSSLRDSTADFIIGGSGLGNGESYGPRADEIRLSNGALGVPDLLITPIPEPSTAVLLLGGIAVLGSLRRQRK